MKDVWIIGWTCLAVGASVGVVGCGGARVKAAVEKLQSDNPGERRKAAEELGSLGAQASAGRDALIQSSLEDDNRFVRIAAVSAITQMGQSAVESANAKYREAMSAPDAKVRTNAVEAIDKLGSTDAATAAFFAKALSDVDPQVRAMAARALQKMHAHAQTHLPEIHKALEDTDPEVCVSVLAAVVHLKLQSTCPDKLANLLEHPSQKVKQAAAKAVSTLKADGRKYVPRMVALLKEEDIQTLKSVSFALAEMAGDAAEALPALKELRDKDSSTYDLRRTLGDVIRRIENPVDRTAEFPKSSSG